MASRGGITLLTPFCYSLLVFKCLITTSRLFTIWRAQMKVESNATANRLRKLPKLLEWDCVSNHIKKLEDRIGAMRVTVKLLMFDRGMH